MLKKSVLPLLLLWAAAASVFSQNGVKLTGKLIDEHRHEISQAHIQNLTAGTMTVSDDHGRFIFRNLTAGTHVLKITVIGFQNVTDTFRLKNDTLIEIVLPTSVERIDEFVLHAHQAPDHITLSNEELTADFFNERTSENFVESLERLPGLNAISTGTGVSKPMIRGMSFNRVIVNNHGIKQEGQQWGADHGLEVDGFDVDRVEVVKGPSSLIYGSDGLGGVINILPDRIPEKDLLSGEVQTLHKTNNRHYGATSKLQYRKNDIFFIARYTRHEYADMRLPADSFNYNRFILPIQNQRLINTAGKEENAAVTVGLTKDWGTTRLRFSTYNLNMGLFPGAMGNPRSYDLTPIRNDRFIDIPRQEVQHNLISLKGDYYIKNAKINVDLGYQMNRRDERSEPHAHGNFIVDHDSALFLALNTLSGRVSVEYPLTEKLQSITGVSGSYQENQIAGFEYLIPEHFSSQAGIFQTLEYDVSRKWTVFGGLRYDYAAVNTSDFDGEIFNTRGEIIESPFYDALSREFGSYSAGLGVAYEPWQNLIIKANAGKSFRFPVVAEITGNGVHHGNFRHEQGDRDMNAEHGYQFDLSASKVHKNFKISAAAFYNIYRDFIYLRPAPRFSPLPDGVQLWQYTQHDAVYTGYEFSVDYYPLPQLRLGHRSSYVHTFNRDTRLPLPFSPPFTVDHEIAYTTLRRHSKFNYNIGGVYRWVANQNRVDRNELATPGYQRVDLWSGVSKNIKGSTIQLRFEVQNLLNQKYFAHLNRYRLLNLPEQGRNFIIRLIVPFRVFGQNPQPPDDSSAENTINKY